MSSDHDAIIGQNRSSTKVRFSRFIKLPTKNLREPTFTHAEDKQTNKQTKNPPHETVSNSGHTGQWTFLITQHKNGFFYTRQKHTFHKTEHFQQETKTV